MGLVVIEYQDLLDKSKDLSAAISEGYGEDGLGVIAIRGVPGFMEAKKNVLGKAHKLAHLPKETLQSLEDEKSLFNAGWSHGKEKLGDKPDFAKGSFYFNPLTDCPGTEEERAKYPVSYPCNVWPAEDVIPDFEKNCKTLGQLMRDVSAELAFRIDEFAKNRVPTYNGNLGESMKTTEKAKGRLLYYFPLEEPKNASEDSWIGWHNDSGFLTALAGDMYVDEKTGEQIDCPDPSAGLYVVNREGGQVKVDIPEDCMAVQLGECVQIITGGVVQATPHCVKGANVPGVARISHPCFIDTIPQYPLQMPEGCTKDQVSAKVDPKVPPLDGRWETNGMEFGAFLQKTFDRYYEWTTPKAA